MAGRLDIQRVPFGLVDLLGMKGSGDSPHTLAEAIAVTLADGADYYLAPRRVQVESDTPIDIATTGLLQVTSGAVPSNELWLVYAYTVTLNQNTAAATAISLCGSFRGATNLTNVQITETLNVGASSNGGVFRWFERPMVALPGYQFGVTTYSLTGAPAVKGRVRMDFARLSV